MAKPGRASAGGPAKGKRWPRDKSIKRFKDAIRAKTPRKHGQSLDFIIAGRTLSLRRMGCSAWKQPMLRSVNPQRGEPPTGEPCAGEPLARFGGRGDRVNRSSLPLSRLEASGSQVVFVSYAISRLSQY